MAVPEALLEGATGRSLSSERRAFTAIAIVVPVAAAGLYFCFLQQLFGLWTLWWNEPLRSIGMAIPPACLMLCLRVWRLEDFSRGGTWWGLALVLPSLILALASSVGLFRLLHLIVPLGADTPPAILVPNGLLLAAYISGIVLLFGGAQTWRKAWFPLLLLIFVNPVPHFFQALVDLPLQQFAAHTARSFAALIGVPISGGTLVMMFSPDLGMFIAHGCDGLRGAVAMGYTALVVGYLYELSWRRWAVYVLAAVALAYLFNLLRLCAVVIYYWFAKQAPALAGHAALADYIIGGILFFCAALFLFSLPRRWRSCTPSFSS
ncbi:MAG TPA: exosortase J [Gammaproteobacteria bacterium]|nr:exosortase J [Gammaproteobacteria bacterium]